MLLAIDEVNRAGGVLGRSLALATQDVQNEPTAGVVALRKLVQEHGIVAIFGGTFSPVMLAQLDLIHELHGSHVRRDGEVPVGVYEHRVVFTPGRPNEIPPVAERDPQIIVLREAEPRFRALGHGRVYLRHVNDCVWLYGPEVRRHRAHAEADEKIVRGRFKECERGGHAPEVRKHQTPRLARNVPALVHAVQGQVPEPVKLLPYPEFVHVGLCVR